MPVRPSSPLLTVIVLCFGGFCVALTQTLVIPIQGELPRLLDANPADTGWVVTVTLLAAAVTMPISGRLGDLYGKQRVLVISALILIVGSLVCALSSSLEPLLAGRALQGMAMGFIPVGIALMREVTPPELTPTAVAAMSATLGVGGAIGLPLAAWVAQTFDWHALFWMSAVAAALVGAGVAVLVPHVRAADRGSLDFVGAIGLAIGLVAVLLGVSKGNDWGWTDPRTVAAILGGAIVLAAWGFQQLRVAAPLVDLRVTASRPILLTNLGAVAIGFGMMAQSIVMPQLLQLPESTGYGMGQSLLAAGLWMAPGGLAMMLFAPLSSTLIKRIGARHTLMIGATVIGGGYLVAFALMNAPWQLMLAGIIAAGGVAIGYAAMPTLIMGNVPLTEAGSAVGVNALMRSVGTTIASAVMAAVLAGNLTGAGIPSRTAFEICFAVGALAAFAGAALIALVPRTQRAVAPTPVPATATE